MFTENTFGIIETARKIGIEMHRLYSWEHYDIVKPAFKKFGTRYFRRYSQDDIKRAKFVKFLVDKEGYTLKAAMRKLSNKNINDFREQKKHEIGG